MQYALPLILLLILGTGQVFAAKPATTDDLTTVGFSMGDAINIAERQRMLSQRTAKNYVAQYSGGGATERAYCMRTWRSLNRC